MDSLYAQSRQCARKRRYPTRAAAKAVIKENPQYGKPYLCRWCGVFHLGHRHGAEWEM